MKRTGRTQTASTIRRYTQKSIACILSAVFVTVCCPIAFAAEDPAGPLTPDELARMTDEQIAAISQEQSDATLSKMAQLFQDGEKAELDEYFSALGFATTYEEHVEQKNEEWLEEQASLEPSLQPLWQSDYGAGESEKQCHENLTSIGFLVYLMARNLLFDGASTGFVLSELSLLSRESAWPDKWDIGFLFNCHFYDPDTGTNWRGETNTTARDSANFFYQEALSKYRKGDRNGAITSLAHCIHYVQDVAVPHHSANKIAIPGIDPYNHSGFEEFASRMLLDGEYEWNIEDSDYFTLSFYNTWNSISISQSVHNIAVDSKQFVDVVTDKKNTGGHTIVAYAMLAHSMADTSGVLYKFAREVGMI